MVKNTKGGNKSKGMARKNMVETVSTSLRVSEDPAEVYAQVTKIFGGAICQVVTVLGEPLLCHIRGKFRGRGKRDNFISINTWLLVGLREWEHQDASKEKLRNCDVIEVYSDQDKMKLKNNVTSVNWSLFIANDIRFIGAAASSTQEDSGFDFSDEKTQEYQEIIQEQAAAARSGKTVEMVDAGEGEMVCVDDI